MTQNDEQNAVDLQRQAMLARLKEMAREGHLSINRLEEAIGASKGHIQRTIKYNKDFTTRWLYAIFRVLPQFSADWLLLGRGPKLLTDVGVPTGQPGQYFREQMTELEAAEVRCNALEARLKEAEAWRKELDAKLRQAEAKIRMYELQLRAEGDEAVVPESAGNEVAKSGIAIPLYDMQSLAKLTAHGATGAEAQITVPFARPGDIALTVSGVSMTPMIWTGDVICATPCPGIRQLAIGKVYVIVTDDEVQIMQVKSLSFDELVLHSYNPECEDFVLPFANIRQIYRVRGIISHMQYR